MNILCIFYHSVFTELQNRRVGATGKPSSIRRWYQCRWYQGSPLTAVCAEQNCVIF